MSRVVAPLLLLLARQSGKALLVRLGERCFQRALYRFDDAMRNLSECFDALRRTRGEPTPYRPASGDEIRRPCDAVDSLGQKDGTR